MGGLLDKFWFEDRDERHPISELSKREISAIQRSWAPIYADAGKYGQQMFIRLFRADPFTQTYFKSIRDMNEEQILNNIMFKAHAIIVMSSINSAVENLHQPEVVVALMNKLGHVHKQQHIEMKHFHEVEIVLVDMLQNDLKFNDTVMSSWSRFIHFIYKHIFHTLNDNA